MLSIIHRQIRRNWMLILPVLILWATVGILLIQSLLLTRGHFTYGLDDAYIHMAMAKHFAQHGVWGVTKYAFTSSSSSPLWTLLLSGIYKLSDPQEWVPLVLNLLFCTALLWMTGRFMQSRGVPSAMIALLLAGLIFASPMPLVIFEGMEHSLQALLCFLFVTHGLSIKAHTAENWRSGLILPVLAFLLTSVRYEGCFAAAAISILLLARKRYQTVFLTLFAAALPILIYGLISVHQGWYFLPNSVLMKSISPEVLHNKTLYTQLGDRLMQNIQLTPHLFFLTIVAVVLALAGILATRQQRSSGNDELSEVKIITAPLLVFIGISLLHYLLIPCTREQSDYRYQFYLVCLGIPLVGVSLWDYFRLRTSGRSFELRPLLTPSLLLLLPLLLIPTLLIVLQELHSGASGWTSRFPGELLLISIPLLIILFLLRREPILKGIKLRSLTALTVLFLALFFSLVSMTRRGAAALNQTARASANIYEQQIQMAYFLNRFYPGETVAANDIGAINYYNDIHCLDLMGLADREVAELKLKRQFNKTNLASLARSRNCRIAILFNSWVSGNRPDEWSEAGQWRIRNNIISGDDTVSFYAIIPSETGKLETALRKYSSHLPTTVAQTGKYREPLSAGIKPLDLQLKSIHEISRK